MIFLKREKRNVLEACCVGETNFDQKCKNFMNRPISAKLSISTEKERFFNLVPCPNSESIVKSR